MTHFTVLMLISEIMMLIIAGGDKNSLEGEQNLLEYFFTCPQMRSN